MRLNKNNMELVIKPFSGLPCELETSIVMAWLAVDKFIFPYSIYHFLLNLLNLQNQKSKQQ